VTVRLQLLSESGNGSPSVTGADSRTITLGSGHQIAVFVTSIWPQLAAAGFRGTLLIVVTSGPPNSLVLTALNLKELVAPCFNLQIQMIVAKVVVMSVCLSASRPSHNRTPRGLVLQIKAKCSSGSSSTPRVLCACQPNAARVRSNKTFIVATTICIARFCSNDIRLRYSSNLQRRMLRTSLNRHTRGSRQTVRTA
jgi:hypothetical protein